MGSIDLESFEVRERMDVLRGDAIFVWKSDWETFFLKNEKINLRLPKTVDAGDALLVSYETLWKVAKIGGVSVIKYQLTELKGRPMSAKVAWVTSPQGDIWHKAHRVQGGFRSNG